MYNIRHPGALETKNGTRPTTVDRQTLETTVQGRFKGRWKLSGSLVWFLFCWEPGPQICSLSLGTVVFGQSTLIHRENLESDVSRKWRPRQYYCVGSRGFVFASFTHWEMDVDSREDF